MIDPVWVMEPRDGRGVVRKVEEVVQDRYLQQTLTDLKHSDAHSMF